MTLGPALGQLICRQPMAAMRRDHSLLSPSSSSPVKKKPSNGLLVMLGHKRGFVSMTQGSERGGGREAGRGQGRPWDGSVDSAHPTQGLTSSGVWQRNEPCMRRNFAIFLGRPTTLTPLPYSSMEQSLNSEGQGQQQQNTCGSVPVRRSLLRDLPLGFGLRSHLGGKCPTVETSFMRCRRVA